MKTEWFGGITIGVALLMAAMSGCSTSTGSPAVPVPVPLTNAQIFARPAITRGYEQNTWVLKTTSGSGDRETASSVGAALAGLKPSYVTGLIYLENSTVVNAQMISDWQTIRSAVLAANPEAKFDVEISLNPAGNVPFTSAAEVSSKMATVDSQLKPDGWWFDFWSDAEKTDPDWVAAAVAYAHSHGQTVGGNVFGNAVPPGSDAVAFVDDASSNSMSGTPFDFDRSEIAALKASSKSTILLGHLQSNAQNGATTESCVYMGWTEAQRFAYLDYWAQQQTSVGFTFEYPVFYPLCPGAFAYDPTLDPVVTPTTGFTGSSLYAQLVQLVNEFNPLQ